MKINITISYVQIINILYRFNANNLENEDKGSLSF